MSCFTFPAAILAGPGPEPAPSALLTSRPARHGADPGSGREDGKVWGLRAGRHLEGRGRGSRDGRGLLHRPSLTPAAPACACAGPRDTCACPRRLGGGPPDTCVYTPRKCVHVRMYLHTPVLPF